MYEFKNWYPWDRSTSTAALSTDFDASLAPHTVNSAASLATMVNTKKDSQIMIRAFGSNADNEAARLRISGWMENGPGQILLDMDCTLGSLQFTEDIVSSKEPSAAWVGFNTNVFECDTYALTVNNCRAYVETAGANSTGFVVMNTMQCRYLELQVDTDGTSGTTSESFGLIWRPLS